MKYCILLVLVALPALAEDTWQKMKDCAARADKIVAREQPDLSKMSEEFINSNNYDNSNHYSPKYNRCYVLLRHTKHEKDQAVKITTRHMQLLLNAASSP
jgi:hypothetical protein